LSLYLHFPFCKQKCAYCDFNSYDSLENLIVPYVEALRTEIESYLPEQRLVRSIFFGGGTPSYLPAKLLEELLCFIKEYFQLSHNAEITIETNPGTVKKPELAQFKSVGFNRLSIGLQASQDRLLRGIGRIHSWVDFLNVFEAGRSVGFNNLSVDLIFGLPGQTFRDWRETLERTVSLQPEHISAYGLQLESGTKLAADIRRSLTQLPSEDEVVEMMNLCMNYLPDQGYQHYEISNYAKPDFECDHNLSYWRGGNYLGFGAGAYSTDNNERWFNIKEPWDYVKTASKRASVVKERESLDAKTKAVEALMLGLRLRSGIDLQEYEAKYGIDLIKASGQHLKNLADQKMVSLNGSRLALTKAGVVLSNSVISSLLTGI
jgi:oxygen-independent coproporphyrinogen-3 oxidase